MLLVAHDLFAALYRVPIDLLEREKALALGLVVRLLFHLHLQPLHERLRLLYRNRSGHWRLVIVCIQEVGVESLLKLRFHNLGLVLL